MVHVGLCGTCRSVNTKCDRKFGIGIKICSNLSLLNDLFRIEKQVGNQPYFLHFLHGIANVSLIMVMSDYLCFILCLHEFMIQVYILDIFVAKYICRKPTLYIQPPQAKYTSEYKD